MLSKQTIRQLSNICVGKMNQVFRIATHSGKFHADDVLACFMLKQLPEYRNSEIIRTRDQELIDACDVVVDVGGVYDPEKHRYDHHQKSFTETMQTLRPEIKSTVRLSSSGLVFHHFGKSVCEAILDRKITPLYYSKLFEYVYFHFMQEIDAIDNGVPMYNVDAEPLYTCHTSLSSRIGHLSEGLNFGANDTLMPLFEHAMEVAGKELVDCVKRFSELWWPAREKVENAINSRFDVHSSGEIIEVPLCPWLSHVFDIEEDQNIVGTIKFGIFSDSGGDWRCRAVSTVRGGFALRVPIHGPWRGLRDKELQEKSGISDAVFVHNTGFIGGASSRDGVLNMAKITLELNSV